MFLAGGDGTQYVRHWRHYSGESCRVDDSSESVEHRHAKEDIEHWLRTVPWADDLNVEPTLASSRPDVMFTHSNGDTETRVAVEIQLSQLAADDLRQRTRDRTRDGLSTWWMFHENAVKRATETSEAGNDYLTFPGAMRGYRELVGATDELSLHVARNHDYGSPAAVQKVDLFDDPEEGGFVSYRPGVSSLTHHETPGGLRVTTDDSATVETTKNEDNARLFDYG
jgi:competence CoiA-like predicted nuclease